MRTIATIAALVLPLALAGCGGMGLYSKVEFNVRPATARTLEQLLENNGPPDIQGQVGNLRLVGWRGAEGMSIWDRVLTQLPLFAKATKPSYVALVDENGKVITASRGRPGRLQTILGVNPAPVIVAETKH